ncbi:MULTISPECIES: aspartyl-phosphate phosphatase Spo0E family protein [Clostridium]|uniref:aspartyl-phosphate phosphatase Spo0E family protein n=1 Tax=Clostridium TaxID=1485 RepID=UPI0018AB5AA3|nr:MULTISPECIES: aspartyl-phosphate phosphatase Spo0E family protein [Clostridium]MBX9184452.1 aspartyl-phosphate phosphatase Spo0E family protein [Clostridium sp. K04]
MKELREKLHKTIDEYGRTDERTVAISQELDKLVCEAQKLIIKKGLSYIEAIEKAKEKLLSDRVGAHKSDNNLSKQFNDSITEN